MTAASASGGTDTSMGELTEVVTTVGLYIHYTNTTTFA